MAFDEIDPRNLLRDPSGPVGDAPKDNPIRDREPFYPVISVAYLPRAAKDAHFSLIEQCVMAPFRPEHLKAACGMGRGNAYQILHGIAVNAKDQLGKYPVDQNLLNQVIDILNRNRDRARGILT